jgi:putative glutamine amidotransferase
VPRRPLIGIGCEFERHPEHRVRDQSVLFRTYTDAVAGAGGVPVVIPLVEDRAVLAAMLERLDGLVFPGGEDVPPATYGQEPHPTIKPMTREAYELHAALTELVMENRKPLLAICAGQQIVNVALGGTLIQDIASQTGTTVRHHTFGPGHDPSHDVEVDPGSRLGAILGQRRARVNSAHHQAVDRLADRLVVTARCPDDGIIEAVELPDHPFLVCVQWHPERIADSDSSRKLFSAFLTACGNASES